VSAYPTFKAPHGLPGGFSAMADNNKLSLQYKAESILIPDSYALIRNPAGLPLPNKELMASLLLN